MRDEQFEKIYEDMINNAFGSWAHGNWFSGGTADYKKKPKDPLLSQCLTDAVEYFNSTYKTEKMRYKDYRMTLSAEEKERIVTFLKNRLKNYEKVGFIVK